MVLKVDTSEPLLRPTQLAALVEAVRNAADHDEDLWIEWKSGYDNDGGQRTHLDLAAAAGLAQIAKAVLGMANRDPGAAARRAGGHGYLLVGVEPGAVNGVRPVDHQVLVSKMRAYVGDVVRWHPEYVTVGGVEVLVVIVDPPRPGDPIHPLRKQIGRYEAGAVFVRRPGLTDRASVADLEMLQNRLLERTPSLQVTVAAVPATIERTPDIPATVEQWVEQRRPALLGARYAAPQRQQRGFADLSSAIRGLDVFGPKYVADSRTEEEYVQEVETYLERARQALLSRAAWEVYRYPPAMLQVEVTNPTDLGFLRVRLVVHVAGDVHCFPEEMSDLVERDRPSIPRPPEPLGTPSLSEGHRMLQLANVRAFPHFQLSHIDVAPGLGLGYTVRDTGSVDIEYDEFELRPDETIRLDPVPLLVREDPGTILPATWHATAEGVRKRLTGEFPLAVAESSLDLDDLDHGDVVDE